MLGALSGAGSWLYNAGANILQGLLNGIESMIGRIRDALHKVTGMIPDWKGPRETDRKLLEPAGGDIMRGLTAGMTKQIPELRRLLGSVTTEIPAMAMTGRTTPQTRTPAAPVAAAGAASRGVTVYVQRGAVQLPNGAEAMPAGDVQRLITEAFEGLATEVEQHA